MTKSSLLNHLNVAEDQWSTLPDVLSFEFTNQRYIYTSIIGRDNPVRWFKIIDSGDGDPIMALQNRNKDNQIMSGGFTYDGNTDIHQIFYISEISGLTFR